MERQLTLMEKKQVLLKLQQEEVSRLLQTQVGGLHRQAGGQRNGTVKAEEMGRKEGPGSLQRAGGLRYLTCKAGL